MKSLFHFITFYMENLLKTLCLYSCALNMLLFVLHVLALDLTAFSSKIYFYQS